MSTVIVGNGTSLLSQHNGNLIDSFDRVVRFNSYDIEPYQNNVGTKTTTWFNVINFKDMSNWRLLVPYQNIVLHSWQWNPQRDALFINFTAHFAGKPNAPSISKTTRTTVLDMAKYAGCEYTSFSTGAIAIWMLTREAPVTITGFDWWDTAKHHYNDNAPRGTLHQPMTERSFIYRLVADGLVTFL